MTGTTSTVTKELLAKRAEAVRLGGKGTMRRKTKGAHKANGTGDKKLEATLKRLGVSGIGDVDEVNFFREDQSVLHFASPKVEANIAAHTYVIRGKPEVKSLQDVLPHVLTQLGAENAEQLKAIARALGK